MQEEGRMVDVAISKIRSVEDDSLQTYVRSACSGMNVIYRHAVRGRNSFGLVPLLVQITRKHFRRAFHWLALVGSLGGLHSKVP
jgi:hypothetical protein